MNRFILSLCGKMRRKLCSLTEMLFMTPAPPSLSARHPHELRFVVHGGCGRSYADFRKQFSCRLLQQIQHGTVNEEGYRRALSGVCRYDRPFPRNTSCSRQRFHLRERSGRKREFRISTKFENPKRAEVAPVREYHIFNTIKYLFI